jgi:YVTN family beta-propeller protein
MERAGIFAVLNVTLLVPLLAGCAGGGPDARAPGASPDRPAQPVRGAPSVRVYVSNERSNDISVIDGGTNAVIATIPVGKRPRGLRVSADGRKLYVALSGSPIAGPNVRDEDLPPADKAADGIGVVDLATGKFVAKIASGSDPEQFSFGPGERHLYVANEDVGQASVVDVAAGKVIKTLKVGYEPEGVTTSPDGRLVYVTSESHNKVHVISTATNEIVAEFQTSARPRSSAFLPDGTKAYVTCENGGAIDVVDVAANKVIRQIRPPGENIRPMGAVVSPDGTRAYVSTGRGRTVAVIDTASDTTVGTIADVGERVWGIDLTPDGKTLYTANGPSNDVTVIDTTTQTVIARIRAGQSPWGVAVTRTAADDSSGEAGNPQIQRQRPPAGIP